jgi:hypothetical protein
VDIIIAISLDQDHPFDKDLKRIDRRGEMDSGIPSGLFQRVKRA